MINCFKLTLEMDERVAFVGDREVPIALKSHVLPRVFRLSLIDDVKSIDDHYRHKCPNMMHNSNR